MSALIYFIGAIALITIAHFIRVYRWGLFIQVYEKPSRSNLTMSVAVGYLLNYILPYKLGDLFRAYIAGRKMKSGRALGLSSVVVDRFLDIICVGFVFLILTFSKNGGWLHGI